MPILLLQQSSGYLAVVQKMQPWPLEVLNLSGNGRPPAAMLLMLFKGLCWSNLTMILRVVLSMPRRPRGSSSSRGSHVSLHHAYMMLLVLMRMMLSLLFVLMMAKLAVASTTSLLDSARTLVSFPLLSTLTFAIAESF